MHSRSLLTSSLLVSLVLAGCSLAPTYQRPDAPTPAAYKEAPPATQSAQWKKAEPSDTRPRGEWWKAFNDPKLDELQQQALSANQSLRAAAARLGQARALEKSARAALFPQIGVGYGPTRQLPSPASQGLPPDASTTPVTLWRGQATFSYEIDLFGRVGSLAEGARLDAERDQALFGSLLLALQADVAQAYFLVRELDATRQLFAETIKLRQTNLQLTQRRFDAGDISELELARSKAELASSQAEGDGIARQRAVAEHALAILLGKAPAEFSLPEQAISRLRVDVPVGLPSSLLERRPDIAAAERAMAAANERIGAARAAYFPRLSLTGSYGYEAARRNDLFQAASRTYAIGPLLGTMLTLPLFDGGARAAGVERANAAYEEEVANYRQTILQAFKEVEDNLAHLRILESQTAAQDQAQASANRAAQISRIQYREGAISQLGVIDAERTALQQQRNTVVLDGQRARAVVNLIRALGGSWQPSPPSP